MNGAQPYGRTVTLIAPLRLSRAMANASDARSSGKVWVTSGAETVNNTLGVLLKYQDDIAKMQGSEAARLIERVRNDALVQGSA